MTFKMTYRAPVGVALTVLALGLTATANAASADDAFMTKVMLDRFELRELDNNDKLAFWEGQVNVRNDYQGLAFKTNGERAKGGPTESAEYQLLYQRLISDFFDAQFGIRYDNQPGPSEPMRLPECRDLRPISSRLMPTCS